MCIRDRVTEEIKALAQPDNGIVIKGFVSEEELARLYATCKVVVVPLRYGAGVKGKVVEAIYNGAPIVTTPTGAEGIPFVDQVLKIADGAENFASATISPVSYTHLRFQDRRGLSEIRPFEI